MQITRTTAPDPLADAAHTLGMIEDSDAHWNAQHNCWDIRIAHSQRKIRIVAIDGEWNAGIEIYVFNRAGVIMAQATVHIMGASPRFVAEMAASLNREIR